MVNHICEPISSNQFASCSSARVGQGGGGAPLTVDQPHENQVLSALRRGLPVERGARDRHQLALAHDREPCMTGVDHRLPPIPAQRSKAFDKKSRSTTSWPILACSFVSSASRFRSRSKPFSSKTLATFSIASRFQSAIYVGCSSALLPSP